MKPIVEVIRVKELDLMNAPRDRILEIIDFKQGDIIERIYYDNETHEHVVRVTRACED